MTRARLPGPARGLAIGLLGGSFNPAHEGHRLVAETALRRLGLDAVWWVVARGNPLKSDHGDYAQRLASAQRLARGKSQRVTDIELQLDLTYTVDTLRTLRKIVPGGRFVWLMGADNLTGFHRWKDWEVVARTLPVAVIGRPGVRLSKSVPFTRKFAGAYLPERESRRLADMAPPAWTYIRVRENLTSSTALRATP